MIRSRTARVFLGTIAAILLAFMLDGLIIAHANWPSIVEPARYPISFRHAATIAQDQAPDATIVAGPTLISYAGAPVYEVLLDRGMVYVHASTGQVMANTARGPLSCQQSLAVD